MPTALPKPKATKTSAAGKSQTTAQRLQAKLDRQKALIAKAKVKAAATGKAVMHSVEIQAATFGSSFASGWMRAKGKSLKVFGVDARIPTALTAGVGGLVVGGEAGDHALAIANGVMASYVAELAFDLGVKAAKSKGGDTSTAVEGVDEDDDDEEVGRHVRRRGRDHRPQNAKIIRLQRHDVLDDDQVAGVDEDEDEVGLLLTAAKLGTGALLANTRFGKRVARKVRGRGRGGSGGGGGQRRRRPGRAGGRAGGGRRGSAAPAPEYYEDDHYFDDGDDYNFDGADEWDDGYHDFDAAVDAMSDAQLQALAGVDEEVVEGVIDAEELE